MAFNTVVVSVIYTKNRFEMSLLYEEWYSLWEDRDLAILQNLGWIAVAFISETQVMCKIQSMTTEQSRSVSLI